MKRLWAVSGGFAVLVLLLASITACGNAQLGEEGLSTATISSVPQSTTTTGMTTSTYSPEEVEQKLHGQWYGEGLYMGFWAGNVETIPAHPKSLPEFFFSGPTPSAPVEVDNEGNPIQKDPSQIGKPLWVFGNEVNVGDYHGQINRAKEEGRPVVFYSTSPPEATSALGLDPRGEEGHPLDHLFLAWLPWESTTGVLYHAVLRPDALSEAQVFADLVMDTLRTSTPVPTTTTLPPPPGTPTTVAATTTTFAPDLSSLGDLDWPKEGLQPEPVVEAIRAQQGSNRGPIYLPRRLPEGFQVPESYRTTSREGFLQSSPNPGPPGGGAKPGYILYLWNGTDYIWFAVNFAGDVGEATWEDTGIPFEGTSFQRVVDTGFLAAVGAEQAKVEINGCSDNHLADKKYLREALEIAKELVRVE